MPSGLCHGLDSFLYLFHSYEWFLHVLSILLVHQISFHLPWHVCPVCLGVAAHMASRVLNPKQKRAAWKLHDRPLWK